MTPYISLLRGINVGGHHSVKMPALKELYLSLGLSDVSTYLQSGNVLFKSTTTHSAKLERHIEDQFEKRFGFHVDVVNRTLTELKAIIDQNPFQQPQEPNKRVVMFLSSPPDEQARQALLKAYSGPEKLCFLSQELYIDYVHGMGRSQLSNTYIERKLKTTGTARNWNTVTKLMEILHNTEGKL